jgi:hypothetical protein
MKCYNIVLVFVNIICNNAFILPSNINLNNKVKLYKNERNTLLLSNINNSNSISDSNSKSFYDFIKQNNLTLNVEENYVENYVENYITKFVENYEKNETQNETLTHKYLTTYNSYEKYIKAPLSKDLKMLTPESSREWAKTWTFEMIHESNQFPTFMFHDMFKMRDFCTINCSRNYFYIGYFPKKLDLKQGPYFIGAFELRPHSREFLTHAIIQNPYYYNINYDKTKIVDFKKELLALCRDASVFLKFSNLRNSKNERYYYSWLYDNI